MFRYFLFLLLVSPVLSAADMRDPTRPPESAGQTANNNMVEQRPLPLKLSGVTLAPNARSAIINGRRVEEGDWVDDARVIEIGAAGVRIKQSGASYQLRLVPISIRQDEKLPGEK